VEIGVNLSVSSENNGDIYAGGVVGRCESLGWIRDVKYSGSFTAKKTTFGGENYIGGIIGRAAGPNLDACTLSGTLTVPGDADGEKSTGI
jgi:hypothetical protein